ncbi:hypothetical protein AAFF_G00316680 [Aldrovandia affinis]|uniref:PiggyBac transposable element-derived protein domain-containing protein n=1 Tax=Aldrovandia affinis TaxID=143900 RepID=A0AAD7WQW2_9TELE|nr:hypothetical protein AAFF_G00316680 [Aldrovandia affinis]
MTPGPTRIAVTRITDIKSVFELLMPKSIQKIVIEMTNLEGGLVFGENWKEMDNTLFKAYIGLLILAGVYRSKDESTQSLWDAETGRSIFRATMSQKQFQMFSRTIRFDNRVTRRRGDKLAPIRTLWDKWVEHLPLFYNPGPNVTVDERLVAFRGRCPFKQYMPSKPAKYGIKIWVATDAKSSYALNMQVYTGRPVGEAPERNQGKRVVLDMVKGLRGHNITCDNFFTSYNLGQELLKKKLTMIGTVRKNRTELPAEVLVMKDRAPLSSKFAFTETTALVSYCPKKGKNVVLMSTLHKDAEVSVREDQKPTMVLDYNGTKGGVDNLDKVTACYSTKRMTARWPLVVFYNMIDVSVYNAFVIWREMFPEWNQAKLHKRRIFHEELGKALVVPAILQRQHTPRTSASVATVKAIRERASPCTPMRCCWEEEASRCSLREHLPENTSA